MPGTKTMGRVNIISDLTHSRALEGAGNPPHMYSSWGTRNSDNLKSVSYSERKGGLNSMQDSFQSQTHCFFKKPQSTKHIKRRRLVPQKYKCFYCARTLAHPAAEPLAERPAGCAEGRVVLPSGAHITGFFSLWRQDFTNRNLNVNYLLPQMRGQG